MELVTEKRKTTLNIGEHQAFTIKATSKAFSILSSNLYSDPIRAIIRELSTNAYDAHVAAGVPEKPFQVHLPGQMEPRFSIRDFGPGMSNAEVFNLYTSYFDSNKTDSNEFVGALGLGSKSVFSYVDTFSVTSFQNGVVSLYSCFLSSEGVPQVALINEDIDEGQPDGLKVEFPVKDKDFYTFRDKATEVYRPFKTLPEDWIESYGDPRFQNLVGDFGDFLYTQNAGSIYNAENSVIQGNVEYPVNFEMLTKWMTDHKEDSKWLALIENISLRIWFPIGKLSVAPSREALHYDEHTLSNLYIRYKYVAERWLEDLQVRIDQISGERWEATKLIMQKFFPNTSTYHDPPDFFKLLTFHGKPFTHKLSIHWDDVKDLDSDKQVFTKFACVHGKSYGVSTVRLGDAYNNKLTFNVSSDAKFYLNDTEIAEGTVKAKIKTDLRQTHTQIGWLFPSKEAIEMIGAPSFTYVSTIKKINTTTNAKGKVVPILTLIGKYNGSEKRPYTSTFDENFTPNDYKGYARYYVVKKWKSYFFTQDNGEDIKVPVDGYFRRSLQTFFHNSMLSGKFLIIEVPSAAVKSGLIESNKMKPIVDLYKKVYTKIVSLPEYEALQTERQRYVGYYDTDRKFFFGLMTDKFSKLRREIRLAFAERDSQSLVPQLNKSKKVDRDVKNKIQDVISSAPQILFKLTGVSFEMESDSREEQLLDFFKWLQKTFPLLSNVKSLYNISENQYNEYIDYMNALAVMKPEILK